MTIADVWGGRQVVDIIHPGELFVLEGESTKLDKPLMSNHSFQHWYTWACCEQVSTTPIVNRDKCPKFHHCFEIAIGWKFYLIFQVF